MNSVEHGRSNAGERQRIWTVRVAALLFGVCVIAALAPIIWAAMVGGVRLLALALFGAFGVAMFQALPLLGQKLEVTRPFSGSNTGDVAALERMLERELFELKDGDDEPGWNEIESFEAKVEWARFAGAAASKK